MNVMKLLMSRESSLVEGTPDEVAEKQRKANEEAVRPARLDAARRQPKWTEIENDLVPRGYKGTQLVSAETDHVYRRYAGPVFQPGTASVIPDQAELYFTVDANHGLTFYEREPGTWSDRVARQARRKVTA